MEPYVYEVMNLLRKELRDGIHSGISEKMEG